jgi:predicted RNA-binding protein YlxR (DUF448 family)
MTARHVPIRTCAGCRTEHPKREMVRVVRTPEGAVVIDPSGKRAGRGAYVCARPDCRQRALRGGSLARALKAEIPTSELAALRDQVSELPSESLPSRATAAR